MAPSGGERRLFKLVVRAQAGDRQAAHALLKHFRPLVRSFVQEFRYDYASPDDLEQIGFVGVLDGILSTNTRDWELGAKLLSLNVRVGIQGAFGQLLDHRRHIHPTFSPWVLEHDDFLVRRGRPRLCAPWRRQLSTNERNWLLRSRRGDDGARQHLLSVLAPYVDSLVDRHSYLAESHEPIEETARLAVLEVADQYPLTCLSHTNPPFTLFDWVDGGAEGSFRRMRRLRPYDSDIIFRRAEERARLLLQEANLSRNDKWLRILREDQASAEPTHSGRKRRTRTAAQRPQSPGLRPRVTELPVKDLVALAKAGYADARQEVCARFLPLIRSLTPRNGNQEDLEQEAHIGLLKAVDEYDQSRGTFAWLAERRIKDALNRVYRHEPDQHEEYSEEYEEKDDENGKETGVAWKIAQTVFRWYDEADNGSYGIWSGAGKDLGMAMAESLAADEREMLGRLFGLPGYEKATQEDLAAELGVTQQAVSKRFKRAMKGLEGADWRGIRIRRINNGEDDW